jgi:hypothetical protein
MPNDYHHEATGHIMSGGFFDPVFCMDREKGTIIRILDYKRGQ